MSSTTPASMTTTPSTIPLTGIWFHRVGLAPYTYLGLYAGAEPQAPVAPRDTTPQRSAA